MAMAEQIPPEIITEILSYLGKNDLLKCRLVSQSWNGLSLKILRNPNYEHYHELIQDNIEDFIRFSNGRDEEWVLPLDLYFYRDEDEESVDYHQILNYIQQLQTIFGQKCVSGLTLCLDSNSSLECVKELISILTLVAPSLNYLDLSRFKLRLNETGEMNRMEEMIDEIELNFPNLLKLVSCPAPTWLNEDGVLENKNNYIHSFLIANSKNLKELDVKSSYDLCTIDGANGIFRKLRIVYPLEDYKFCMEPIQNCPTLHSLKELSLTYTDSVFNSEELNKFLSFFSTSLQNLTVIFQEIPTNPFPRLSQLKFLRIQVLSRPNLPRIHVDPEELNLNSEVFPVLESMDISTNGYFESKDGNSGSSKDDRILGTLKNLIIRVTNSPFEGWEMEQIDQYEDEDMEITSRATSAKDYVEHLQELFLNVSSLTLVDESDGHEEYLKQLLIAFIQSDGAPKIKELEIQNFEKNYLGHILNGLDSNHEPRVIIENMKLDDKLLNSIKYIFPGFPCGSELRVDKQMETRDGVETSVITFKAPIVHFKMTGLEKIKMSCLKKLNHKFGQSGSEQESNQKDLFLMSLPKHFPLLRQIYISEEMFGHDKEFCKRQIVNAQEKFPHLIINTTR